MHEVGLSSLPHIKTPLTPFSIFLYQRLSLCENIVLDNCCILSVYSFTCVSFLPYLLSLFCLFLILSVWYFSVLCLFVALHFSYFLSCLLFSPFSLHLPLLHCTVLFLISSLLLFPSPLSSGCVKFNWGSERVAFKPGGRRTRFLSTPCLALCV